MQKYTGGCHCGKVKYEVEADLSGAITCNCSLCSKRNWMLTFVKAPAFKLISGEDNLTEYTFNRKAIRHLFCKTCGVQCFGHGPSPEGDTYAVNIYTLDGVDPSKLSPTHYNGKDI